MATAGGHRLPDGRTVPSEWSRDFLATIFPYASSPPPPTTPPIGEPLQNGVNIAAIQYEILPLWLILILVWIVPVTATWLFLHVARALPPTTFQRMLASVAMISYMYVVAANYSVGMAIFDMSMGVGTFAILMTMLRFIWYGRVLVPVHRVKKEEHVGHSLVASNVVMLKDPAAPPADEPIPSLVQMIFQESMGYQFTVLPNKVPWRTLIWKYAVTHVVVDFVVWIFRASSPYRYSSRAGEHDLSELLPLDTYLPHWAVYMIYVLATGTLMILMIDHGLQTFILLARPWRQLEGGFNHPQRAVTFQEMWSKRWHQLFSSGFRQLAYHPVRRRAGAFAGLMAVFLCSGLLHIWIVAVGFKQGFHAPTLLFFMVNGLLTAAEIFFKWRPSRLRTVGIFLSLGPLFTGPYARALAGIRCRGSLFVMGWQLLQRLVGALA